MFAEERHELILREVREKGSVRLADLVDRLGVSMVTLRRDVESLAAQGLVNRVHGGITRPAVQAEESFTAGTTFAGTASTRTASAGTASTRTASAGTASAGTAFAGAADQGSGRALTIGMLVPSATYYYPAVIKGARAQAERLGVRLVLGVSRYDDDEDRKQVKQLIGGGVDGLLLTPSRQPDATHADWLAGLGVPAVLVERRAELGGPASLLDAAASHHAHGAFLGIRHLAELGHRRVAMVTRNSPTAPRVRHGFQRAVRDLGLECPGEFGVEQEGPSPSQVDAVTAAISDGLVTGLLVHNDEDALLLVQHLRIAGVRIPSDVSIVAYDDEVAALSDPALTAVAPPKLAVGRTAVDLLIRRIQHGPDLPTHHLALLPELRPRTSTTPHP